MRSIPAVIFMRFGGRRRFPHRRWHTAMWTGIALARLLAPGPAAAVTADPQGSGPGAGGTGAGATAAPTWLQHPARPFAITATEVTVAQFRACVDAGACNLEAVNVACNYGNPDRRDHPVNCVTYLGAEQYCAHVGGRMCSEDEWLEACRGTDGRSYPYGAVFDAEACNVQSGSQSASGSESESQSTSQPQSTTERQRATAPVGSNARCEGGLPGLYDMAGNVAEWVNSCTGSYCKFRGAGYISNDPINLFAGCSGVCSGNDKGFQSGVVGIRCCRDASPGGGP